VIEFDALIFDLDGTLIDTAPDFMRSLEVQLDRHQRSMPPEHLLRCGISDGSAGLISRAFGIDNQHVEFEALRNEFLDIYYQKLAEETAPFAGIDALLEECKKRSIPWSIATNKPWRYTEPVLAALDLLIPAAAVICPDHVVKTKPDPEPVLLACNIMGVKPDRAIMIGDHVRDIESGQRAGAATIAAAWGYLSPDEDAETWRADHTLSCSTQLHQLLFSDDARSAS